MKPPHKCTMGTASVVSVSGFWSRLSGRLYDTVHYQLRQCLPFTERSPHVSKRKSQTLCVICSTMSGTTISTRGRLVLVKHESLCRSVCERVRASRAGRDLIGLSCLAPEGTTPDRPSSTPGTLPPTAGDWPAACQSVLAPPPCPIRMQKHKEERSLLCHF